MLGIIVVLVIAGSQWFHHHGSRGV